MPARLAEGYKNHSVAFINTENAIPLVSLNNLLPTLQSPKWPMDFWGNSWIAENQQEYYQGDGYLIPLIKETFRIAQPL